MRLSKVRAIC